MTSSAFFMIVLITTCIVSAGLLVLAKADSDGLRQALDEARNQLGSRYWPAICPNKTANDLDEARKKIREVQQTVAVFAQFLRERDLLSKELRHEYDMAMKESSK